MQRHIVRTQLHLGPGAAARAYAVFVCACARAVPSRLFLQRASRLASRRVVCLGAELNHHLYCLCVVILCVGYLCYFEISVRGKATGQQAQHH